MRKLKHIITWTVWSLLALYLLILTAVQLSPVQRWLAQTAASALGDKLGTTASVGRVNLGFLNRIIIDDIKISDQQSAPLLQARRLAAKIDLMPLLDGRVRISSAQLFGAQLTLSRDSAGATPNYQFALDALSSPRQDEPSSLDLRIGSLIVRQLAVSYDQNDAPATPHRLNPRHLQLKDISAHVLLRALTADTLSMSVKRLMLHEASGIDLERLSFRADIGRHTALLTDFSMQLPHSLLSIDTLQATYSPDSLAPTLAWRTAIAPGSHIALADLAAVLPPNVPLAPIVHLHAAASGGNNSINVSHLDIYDDQHLLELQASARLDNLLPHPSGSVSIARLQASDQLLAELRQANPAIPAFAGRLGGLELLGDADFDAQGTLAAQGTLRTDAGHLQFHGSMASQQWSAHVSTDSLDLQRLTGMKPLGIVAADLDLGSQQQAVGATGTIARFDCNGYSYRNIGLDAAYSTDGLTGKLKIDEPNISADVEGSFHNGDTPRMRLTGFIGALAPQALHLSDRWGETVFSAVVDADVSATSLADAQGTIDLDDFFMAYNDATQYHLDNLHVRLGNDADGLRYVRMNCDFGEAQLRGQLDWSSWQDSNFDLYARLTDSQWMQHLLGMDVSLQGALTLDAHVDAPNRLANVYASIPSAEYAGYRCRDAVVELTSRGDSAHCQLGMQLLTANGRATDVGLTAQATPGQVNSSLRLGNGITDGGTINAIARFYRNEQNASETHVRLLPSHIVLHDALWELEPCDILYSDRRAIIDHFSLHHDDEHIIVDGVASQLPTDTLMLDLRGVDVAQLLDMANFHAVSFGGRASGRAFVCQAFANPQAWADIAVEPLLFQDAAMGTLEAHTQWNAAEGQIELEAAIDDGADAQTFVDGYISPVRGDIDLGFMARGTSAAFIHSFTKSFMSSFHGHINGDVRLSGSLKQLNLTGQATVDGRATVSPLGTTYTFSDAQVVLQPDGIVFNHIVLADREGHEGTLDGAVTHNHLKNFGFDLAVSTQGLLAYDFPQPGPESTIGGTVYATGQALLIGRPGEVLIDCDVTPAPGTTFVYNAASPDAINQQQFITWGEAYTDPTQRERPGAALPTADAANEQEHPSSDLRMNLRINATPDATLRVVMDQRSGEGIALGGNGVLRASYYNKGPFQMFGTYRVEQGTYSMTIQNIIRKQFQFLPEGTITFGGDPLQAALNLKAQHTVNGVSLADLGLGTSFTSNTIRVNCLMNIAGTPGEPRVEFDLEMPTVNSEEEQMIRSIMASEQELNQQVVYLLGIGRFYTQGQNNEQSQAYGQTQLAMQSLLSGTVSSQISQLLAQVVPTDDWSFGANISTGDEGWHNAEYEGVVSGRMLNNRLLLNGQFGYRDNATQASPSFIGDFDLRYLLTPGGSLALKAYNQTNDRYFTHSSLNTQGVGLVMKKDFSSLKELFRLRRKDKE